jgi:hypothetical protein
LSCSTEENWRFGMTIIAAKLVALGVVVLALSGNCLPTSGQPVNFPGIHSETTERWHVIPPVAGALAVAGGIALLIVKPKRAV